MISQDEQKAREKYGVNAYTITSGGGLKLIERPKSEARSEPQKEEQKSAPSGYVCPDCGAISFMPIERCDICKSKKKQRRKTAPAQIKIMSEDEREEKKRLMNRMNTAIMRESLKTLPEDWTEEQKASFDGKLTRLKLKYQELRKKLEDDLLARIDINQRR